MKELAYTMDRLNALFQYLELLCDMNEVYKTKTFTVESKLLNVCGEIERELGIDEDTLKSLGLKK